MSPGVNPILDDRLAARQRAFSQKLARISAILEANGRLRSGLHASQVLDAAVDEIRETVNEITDLAEAYQDSDAADRAEIDLEQTLRLAEADLEECASRVLQSAGAAARFAEARVAEGIQEQALRSRAVLRAQLKARYARRQTAVTERKVSPSQRPAVVSLHGIRTRGAWQKDLVATLSSEGLHCIPLDYGNYAFVSFVRSGSRRAKVDWFRAEFGRLTGDLDQPPDVIAHSFGTLILCEALRIYPEIRCNRLILCGSIVSREYPWAEVIGQGRVQQVLNERGGRDIWVKSVGLVIRDAGSSGVHGFVESADQHVLERYFPDWRHSDFFSKLHFKSWLAYLRAEDPGPGGIEGRPRRRWSSVSTMVGVAVSVLLLAVVPWNLVLRRGTTGEEIHSPAQKQTPEGEAVSASETDAAARSAIAVPKVPEIDWSPGVDTTGFQAAIAELAVLARQDTAAEVVTDRGRELGLLVPIPMPVDEDEELELAVETDLESIAALMQVISGGGYMIILESHVAKSNNSIEDLYKSERACARIAERLTRHGIPRSAMRTIAYGSERPVCEESSSECDEANSRMEFRLATSP